MPILTLGKHVFSRIIILNCLSSHSAIFENKISSVVCCPASVQVCASASIIDYEIAPDKANESLCSTSLSLSLSMSTSLLLDRVCVVQVRRLTFRLSGRGWTQTHASLPSRLKHPFVRFCT